MVLDGERHRITEPIVTGIVAPHDPLQFRELAHHVGQQIGLGQTGRSVHLGHEVSRGLRPLSGQRRGDRAHTLAALALGAQLVVIHHLGQALHTGGQGLLAILVEEKLGIGQARAHNTLIAPDHRAGILGVDVAHHQKLVGELALGIEQGEVFLIGLHGQDQTLLWHP